MVEAEGPGATPGCRAGAFDPGHPFAGLTDAWLAGLDPDARLRRALACAVANALVWDAGAIDPGEVRRREEAVVIEPVAR